MTYCTAMEAQSRTARRKRSTNCSVSNWYDKGVFTRNQSYVHYDAYTRIGAQSRTEIKPPKKAGYLFFVLPSYALGAFIHASPLRM